MARRSHNLAAAEDGKKHATPEQPGSPYIKYDFKFNRS